MGVDYAGLLHLEGAGDSDTAATTTFALRDRFGGRLAPIVDDDEPEGLWLVVDVGDTMLDDGIESELETAREWSEALGRRVAVLEMADASFELVIYDRGKKLRHLKYGDDGWVGRPAAARLRRLGRLTS